MSQSITPTLSWHRVLALDELPEGRVKTVGAGHHSFALTHFEGQYAALSNRCPHQGGPLGEGSIEKGLLRCPWHGYDYCPLTGRSEFGDSVPTFPVEVRDDGVYVGIEPDRPHVRTVSDVMAETLVNWGVRHVFGMVGHSNLGLADALRRQEQATPRSPDWATGFVTWAASSTTTRRRSREHSDSRSTGGRMATLHARVPIACRELLNSEGTPPQTTQSSVNTG